MKEIPIRSHKRPGLKALVDDDVYADAMTYQWNLMESKHHLYAISTHRYGNRILLHHLVLGLSSNSYVQVKFKDGNALNCQRENLIRLVNRSKVRTRYRPR